MRLRRTPSGIIPNGKLQQSNFLHSYHQLILAKPLFELLSITAPPVLVQILYHDFIHNDFVVNCDPILLLPQTACRRTGVGSQPSKFAHKFVANLFEKSMRELLPTITPERQQKLCHVHGKLSATIWPTTSQSKA